MKAPKGMKWIDVTYTAKRIGLSYAGGTFDGEACMQILIGEDSAKRLTKESSWADPLCDPCLSALERILRGREELCRGKYVEGSIKDIRIMEDDE